MAAAMEAAKKALTEDQVRRARYYSKQVQRHSEFQVGDKVWVLRSPRGKGITKLTHKWVGPARIEADAGFDNWEVLRDDTVADGDGGVRDAVPAVRQRSTVQAGE
ncbi:hypothetical protein PF005_g23416 [Phytophthora fragariae]|uniref:Uncharacterized protein n=2 Tax=Phytophthora fragariae TaxID=53985 RepID=A0A6A3RMQ4_9STRA|nr:hypothetical protein PF003_g14170 [Phytophthora fragariae]KAE8925641.1 hypothetical protein PF009_g24155 [Phytophthora fragariae]KAE9074748.1 hypothetical protein PF007_g25285 [Phytophthora fragariae]KAE9079556.1 hypothetical protein PF010_g22714 [Phytophthora fragariae]KAE9099415.1 hypothetical protein PF006_g23138 [Phytophthora fragariae]